MSRLVDLLIKNATYVDVLAGQLAHGDIAIEGDRIVSVGQAVAARAELDASGFVAIPGLIDAHIHLESSMVMPAEFARSRTPRHHRCGDGPA